MSSIKLYQTIRNAKFKGITIGTCVLIFSAMIFVTGCKKDKSCNQAIVQQGESVFIPITFIGFAPQEINGIQVSRIDNANVTNIDNFRLEKILWAYSAHSDKEHITDRAQSGSYDNYSSYFNNSTLIFKWDTGADTLSNFIVKKSKVNTDDVCHKDDPNVSVDQVTYIHRGKVIAMDSSITIYKH